MQKAVYKRVIIKLSGEALAGANGNGIDEKVTGSVTSKTQCLINNDITSNSGKNKKAKELQIPILTEEEFMVKYLTIEV